MYVKIGTKITASVEQMFRLQAVSEDDTIYLLNYGISSDIFKAVPVGAGAVFAFMLLNLNFVLAGFVSGDFPARFARRILNNLYGVNTFF